MQAYSEKSTFYNLWRTDKPKEMQLRESSLEQNVSKEAVPLFIMHTPNDEIVDVRNSLCLAEKYRENELLFEMHIYPDGPHGVARK